jgi:hypothetical protein
MLHFAGVRLPAINFGFGDRKDFGTPEYNAGVLFKVGVSPPSIHKEDFPTKGVALGEKLDSAHLNPRLISQSARQLSRS